MVTFVFFISLVLFLLALGCFLLGVVSWTEKLPRNRLFGFRTKESLTTTEGFRAANKVLAPTWMVVGVFFVCAGIVCFALDNWLRITLLVLLLLMFIAVLARGTAVAGQVALHFALKEAKTEESCSGACGCGGGQWASEQSICSGHKES